jgi:excinuclease ABC subunit A
MKDNGSLGRSIEILGSQERNLRSVSCSFPLYEISLISGPSGAGKTSLGVTTLAAEGAARTALLRDPIKWLELPRPRVSEIRHLPPVVTLPPAFRAGKDHSIGSWLGIQSRLRYAWDQRIRYCPRCASALRHGDPESVAKTLLENLDPSTGELLTVLALFATVDEARAAGLGRGFSSLWLDGRLLPAEEAYPIEPVQQIGVVVDRLTQKKEPDPRLVDALRSAEQLGTIGYGVTVDRKSVQPWSRSGNCDRCGFKGRELLPSDLRLLDSITSPRTLELDPCQWWGIPLSEWSTADIGTLRAALTHTSGVPDEILNTLQLSVLLGLGHLPLGRAVSDLSYGEQARLRLQQALIPGTRGRLLILDEPLRGLHPSDQAEVLRCLEATRDSGNTIVLIDHHSSARTTSDWEVALGPDAGAGGGAVVYEGPPLQQPTVLLLRRERRAEATATIQFKGLINRNGEPLSGEIPANRITVVSGVSGSGKSSFLFELLLPAVHDALKGLSSFVTIPPQIKRVGVLPNRDRGATRRSIVATLAGVYEPIRTWYGMLPLAKARGYSAQTYTIGRSTKASAACRGCRGLGVEEDSGQSCKACGGKRFTPSTLDVRWKGRSITELLQTTASEVLELGAAIPSIRNPLQALCELGLGYLQLGQPSVTLSSGEWQRIRLARELSVSSLSTLFLLDEPSCGLSDGEIVKLHALLERLITEQHTIILIEHDQRLIEAADWLLEFGPGAGAFGGRLVRCGALA